MRIKSIYLLLLFIFASNSIFAQYPEILSLKDQAELEDHILKERFETVLPKIMERTGIDMWVIISSEYNEDPVIKTMLPSTWMAARRTTMLVIYQPEKGAELQTQAVARYDVGEIFKRAWSPETQPDQWKRLAEIIAEKNPNKIGLNMSNDFSHADGLVKSEYDLLMNALSKTQQKKVVSAEKLAVGWLETRTERERVIYEQLCNIAHKIIAKGFSLEAITPGVSTTDDLVWWYRQEINRLGLTTWFHPTVDVQRADPESFDHLRSFSKRPDKQIIQPGDLLHVDFGIVYLRLNTDTQQHAYVLRPGEDRVPNYLVKAFEQGKKVQDHLTNQFKTGRTGKKCYLLHLKKLKQKD